MGLWKPFQDYERMNLVDALHSRTFKDGECVIKQVCPDTDNLY